MSYRTLIVLLVVVSIFVTACGTKVKETQNVSAPPTAAEVLKEDNNADLLMVHDTLYQTNIDWVNQLEVTKDKEIGKVESKYGSGQTFKNKMANNIPVGTKIYSTKERNDVLIVEINGIEKKYYALTEG
ncbi:hypothetical protein [Rummeliibacillus sp. BSL5]